MPFQASLPVGLHYRRSENTVEQLLRKRNVFLSVYDGSACPDYRFMVTSIMSCIVGNESIVIANATASELEENAMCDDSEELRVSVTVRSHLFLDFSCD